MPGAEKRFGDLVAVDGVDVTIHTGETCGCWVPTERARPTISMIAGLLERDAGEVVVAGER